MKALIFGLLLAFLLPTMAWAIGPLESSGARQAAQLASDGTVSGGLAIATVQSWNAPNRTSALTCQALKDGIVGAIGLLGQHFIKSPRPDGSGNGMPSLHSLYAGVSFDPAHPVLTGLFAGLTGTGRYLGAKHTFAQVAVGEAIGIGVAYIPCSL